MTDARRPLQAARAFFVRCRLPVTLSRVARGWLLLVLCALGAATAPSSARQSPAPIEPYDVRVGVARPGGGYSIQTIPLETYVARVLAGEAARESPPAALEALAIAIRTYTLANRDRHRGDGFDLCDETHCQVVRAATATTERAAATTAGQVLTRDGSIASIYYSASCGGRTEIPSDVWPGADDPPYLPIMDDEACNGGPEWSAELAESDLLRALRAAGFRGDRLQGFRIVSLNRSGRVAKLSVDGLTPSEISGQDLRLAVGKTLGWQYIKSTLFELRARPGVYRFTGRGYGHGVGLCVIGSTNLAARGVSAPAILARYFPGTALTTIESRTAPGLAHAESASPAPPLPALADVTVVLPDGNDRDRAGVARTVRRARDDLARALGVSPPASLTIYFHPSTDDYERATGRAWFTSGALVNRELHLLPLAVLRERGVLDRTIRHELVHLMADDVLGGRPAWVREGAAIYFADDRPAPSEGSGRPEVRLEPRSACPADNELDLPVSVGALANAYARARNCFVRQVAAGRSWRDVMK